MNLRQPYHGGKHWLQLILFIVLLTIAFGVTQTQVVHAAIINVPCNVTDLVNAITTVNGNGEADALNLAPACTYTLTATLDILADGGNPLTIEGNGATISGNNAVQVFNVTSGALLYLEAVTVSNGTTTGDGGGIYNSGRVALYDSTVSGNTATSSFATGIGDGGGIYNSGTLTITNSTVSGNSSTNPSSSGGGIYNRGTATLTNSIVSGNTTGGGGGGILNQGTLTLTNSTLSGNTSTNYGGGGISNWDTLTLTNSTVAANTGASGGGIDNSGNSSVVTLTNSSVSNNTATGSGGGGGIFNDVVSNLTLTNSSVSNNTATNSYGGGIRNYGTVNLTNSTAAANSFEGIFSEPGSTLTLTNSTVAGNAGTGIYNFGTVNLTNSILAYNAGDCANFALGTITPSGGNLVEDGSCSIAGALSADPMLGGLTGSPAYLPLLPGSPAIDTGDNSVCPATDQRGATRPFDGDGNGTATCDLGAYEADSAGIPTTSTPTPIAPVATEEAAPPPPATPRCEDLNFVADGVVRASVGDALDYAVFCRVLYANGAPVQWLGGDLYDAGSIGHQGVIDLGVVQAVDVYSPVGMTTFEGGVEICLRGQGTLIWLAARNAPRIAEIIGSYTVDDFPGFTCATLFEPGTLVLVRDNPVR